MMERKEFAARVGIAVGLFLLIAGLAVLFALSIDVWFAVFAGTLLAIFIRSLSAQVVRLTHMNEKWAVVLVLVVLVGGMGLLSWWAAGPLAREAKELQERLPEAVAHVQQQLAALGVEHFPNFNPSNASSLLSKGSGFISGAVGIFQGTFHSVITFFIVIFAAIYLAFSPDTYISGLVALFPPTKRKAVGAVLGEVGCNLRHWMFGQLVSMVAVGVMISLGLYFSGVPVPIVLGAIAGLLDIIPIFGPVVGAVPAILLGFTVGPWHALYAIIVFVVANQIEQHLLVPVVQRYSVSLPPALTVVALFLMGSLFGFWGVLLAVPVTAALVVLAKRAYVEPVLGDKIT